MTAEAAVIYTPLSKTAYVGSPSTSVTFGSETFSFSPTVGGKGVETLNFTNVSNHFHFASAYSYTQAYAVAPGASIGPGTSLTGAGGGSTAQILFTANTGVTYYFAFAFNPVMNAPLDYGWASVVFDATKAATLTGYAYEDSGKAISVADVGQPAAAAVPEPAVPLLMAAGVLGLATRRRRATKA